MRKLVLVLLFCFFGHISGSEILYAQTLPWIAVSSSGDAFVEKESGMLFRPWGFNYDHDANGLLIEDYWDSDFPTVEQDFREMKELGANVVRVHLQYGKFMNSATNPNQKNLENLARLLSLAEETSIYLNITGLGCYHKQDVPQWYDAMSETERWESQAIFWESIAAVCKDSSALFCYDLMNEPVVAGGGKPSTDWLGPAFGGKHFVQRITLDTAGRDRSDVAKQWIDLLASRIRRVDSKHLLTVGMVDWSLERPGLTSGFTPTKVAQSLDFIAVHIYPEKGKVDEALAKLEGFQIGKPVVVEETFPLKSGIEDLERFIDMASERKLAQGWIGFYWGKMPREHNPESSIADAITLGWLELFQRKSVAMTAPEASQ